MSLLLLGAGKVGFSKVLVTSWNPSLNINSTAWNGNNMRQLIPASLLSQSGSDVRLTIQSAATGGEGTAITSLYIQEKASSGNAYDFASSPVQLLVGGSGSFTIPPNTAVYAEPASPFAIDETKDYILSAYFNDAANDDVRGRNSVTGATNYFKASANEASSTTAAAGYSSTASAVRLIALVEVLQ
jgi:hypothetical protein